ncbi:hypothetical protein V8F33_003473 [Rhypophila sp. PSN 637]
MSNEETSGTGCAHVFQGILPILTTGQCDNVRPACTPCLRQSLACSYRSSRLLETDHLQRQLGVHQELMHHLCSLPEEESIQLLRRLRTVEDLPGLLASAEGGAAHALLRPSELRMARGGGPPSDSGVEFELMARHQDIYLKITPVATSFLDRIVEIPSPPSRSPARSPSASTSTGTSTGTSTNTNTTPTTSTTTSTLLSGTTMSDALSRLKMDRWTSVPVADDFAAAVLSDYLERGHLILGIFDADTMLDDLVEFGSQICSPLLVNSLMFYACQAYTAVDVRAAPLGLCFFEQAELLYRAEAAVDNIANLAATVILATACIGAGKDAFGQELYTSGRLMGERLGETALLRYTSPSFCVTCRLWAVANEIFLVYRMNNNDNNNNNVPIDERVPLVFVEAKYLKLLDCMARLGEGTIKEQNGPSHLRIPYSNGRLQSFTAADSQPKAIYRASVNQLKQLLLWYYLQDGKRISIMSNPIFLTLTRALLTFSSWSSSISAEDLRYFFLCIRCCAELYISYPLSAGLAQAFLTMALQHRAVSGAEALALLERLKQRGAHHIAAKEAVVACFSDLNLVDTAPDQARADKLGGRFEELSVFDEFTREDDYDLDARPRSIWPILSQVKMQTAHCSYQHTPLDKE